MSSEVIRKLALQQLKEEELKKKEEELQKAVAAEVERLRSRATTEIVQDDLSELRNEIKNLKQKVIYLEDKLSNNPVERKVLELATFMGDTTLNFRSNHGINKRKFRNTFKVIDGHGNPWNWHSALWIGDNVFSFSTDSSKRILNFQDGQNTSTTAARIFDYTFRELGVDSYNNTNYDITIEITQEKVNIQMGNVHYSRDLPRKYRINELFEPGFINLKPGYIEYGFTEYY